MRTLARNFESGVSRKTLALIAVMSQKWQVRPRNILVVGCGTGWEAGLLARTLQAETIGIDIGNEFNFDHEGAAPAILRVMDAQSLAFPNDAFDLVYSFHALEHMNDPSSALQEMARVLKPGGAFMVGAPNRSRLVGYVGSGTPLWNKLRWNLGDWWMRLKGKWSNEAGAHAGFSEKELMLMCCCAFGEQVESISLRYYAALYGARFTRMVSGAGIGRFIFPCVYFVGRKH